MSKRINNHLHNHYSDYNLLFLKRYLSELNINNKILDVGTGHFRNLRLFYELGFNELYGIDKNIPDPIFKDKNFKINFILRNIEQGLPYKDKEFDIVLCNYVLMFINPSKLNFVLDEIMRVCNKFVVIETNKSKTKALHTEFKDYSFKSISDYIENNKDFKLLDKKCYYEKLFLRRVK